MEALSGANLSVVRPEQELDRGNTDAAVQRGATSLGFWKIVFAVLVGNLMTAVIISILYELGRN
jgi:hypothetical protein